MTVPLSTWDAASAAILAAIKLQPAVVNPPPGYPTGGNIIVQEGPLNTNAPDDVIIVDNNGIGQTQAWHALVGSGGAGAFEETYRIGVYIEVYRGGDDALAVRARCKALADAVDVAIRTDPTLGLGVPGPSSFVYVFPASHQFSAAEWAENNLGRFMSCQIEIECVAVI